MGWRRVPSPGLGHAAALSHEQPLGLGVAPRPASPGPVVSGGLRQGSLDLCARWLGATEG